MKIKNITIFLLIVFFYSCKKQYNCRCQTTVSFPSGNEQYFVSKNRDMSKKLTKKQAEAVCKQEETSINSTYTAFFTNNNNWSSGGYAAKTTCKVD